MVVCCQRAFLAFRRSSVATLLYWCVLGCRGGGGGARRSAIGAKRNCHACAMAPAHGNMCLPNYVQQYLCKNPTGRWPRRSASLAPPRTESVIGHSGRHYSANAALDLASTPPEATPPAQTQPSGVTAFLWLRGLRGTQDSQDSATLCRPPRGRNWPNALGPQQCATGAPWSNH